MMVYGLQEYCQGYFVLKTTEVLLRVSITVTKHHHQKHLGEESNTANHEGMPEKEPDIKN